MLKCVFINNTQILVMKDTLSKNKNIIQIVLT